MMGISDLFRNILELGFGLLYLIGAIFNFLYTLRHGDEFYGSFADKAMLASSRQLIRTVVIPQAKLFTGLLIAFELLVALPILSRGGLVEGGLLAGAIFCFSVVLVSNLSGAVANLLMAVVQLFLVLTRQSKPRESAAQQIVRAELLMKVVWATTVLVIVGIFANPQSA